MRKRLWKLAMVICMTAAMSSASVAVKAEEQTKDQLQEKVTALESEKTELESKVEQLESEKTELEEKVKTLEGQGTPETEKETEAETETEKETITPTEAVTEKPETEYTDKETVKVVQEALNAAGFNCGSPDGLAGKKTHEAIQAYQKEKKLDQNGIITDELLDSLGIGEELRAAAEREAAKDLYSADYTYDQLARNPDTYTGKQMSVSGKVLQTGEDGDIRYVRLAMDSDYDCVVFVTYDSSILSYRLLEDDMVTIYGTSLGLYSYEAVSGATITIPWVNADIVELNAEE